MLKALVVAATGLCGALFAANKLYYAGAKCNIPGRLDGKLAVVTGANTGLGSATVAELARRGAHVIMACRNLERAEVAKSEIIRKYGDGAANALTSHVADPSIQQYITYVKLEQLSIEELDLASINSIRKFAKKLCKRGIKIDYLVNNAGVMACPYGLTVDGFELQMGTNHLGHFLLTELLLPAIKAAGPGSRIIFISSRAHTRTKADLIPLNLPKEKYSRYDAYNRSKLANAIYANYLSRSLKTDGVETASVHPGVVSTELFKWSVPLASLVRFVTRPFLKTPWEGAQTTMFTILTNNLRSGAYYVECVETRPRPEVFNEKVADNLVKASREAMGLCE